MTQAPSNAPKKYHPITTIESLQEHLQWAMSVELSTVPPYLCAMYSIQDNTSDAYWVIRSVVFEEMLHMMLVANMMNAIGASPKLSGEYVPKYPGFIPHHAAGGPYIQLQPYSSSLMSVTFMAIEQPEPEPVAPPEGDDFQTIGQFYKAIEQGFDRCVEKYGERGVFGRDTGFQAHDTYFGLGGGRLFEVKNLDAAHRAIKEIVQQGEGAPWPTPLSAGEERFGAKEYYGYRPDDTFGPILGTPWEMSHYYKFQSLANAAHQPAVWPMAANPSPALLAGYLKGLSELFDNGYTLLLLALEKALGSSQEQRFFFGASFPAMQYVVAPLATLLLQTPIAPQADPALGPNAGPGFDYRPATIAEMSDRTEQLLKQYENVQAERGTSYASDWQVTLEAVLASLRSIEASLHATLGRSL